LEELCAIEPLLSYPFVLVGGMFGLPAIVLAVFLPSLKQGLPNPIPVYEQVLLEISAFCLRWRFLLALPIVSVLFTIAAFTHPRTPAKLLSQRAATFAATRK
jgi:type II secretory pathway component PulF